LSTRGVLWTRASCLEFLVYAVPQGRACKLCMRLLLLITALWLLSLIELIPRLVRQHEEQYVGWPSSRQPRVSFSGCHVHGKEPMRIAVCFFGMTRNIENTIDSIRSNLLAPLTAVSSGALDVFVHSLLLGELSSNNLYHPDEAENSVPLHNGDFLELHPCRFAAEDQDVVDERPPSSMSNTSTDNRNVPPAWWMRKVAAEYASPSQPRWSTIPIDERSLRGDLLRLSLWIANHARYGKRNQMARKLGVRYIGIQHYTDKMILNALRACYSLAEVAKLVLAHERARGWRYTHLVAARPDVAVLSRFKWRAPRFESKLLAPGSRRWLVIPNFAHNLGVNDRFAYGEREAMLVYMDQFAWLRRSWPRMLNNTEGILCEYLKAHRIWLGVTPLCLVRTRATGAYVQEVLNSSKARVGLPHDCPGLQLLRNLGGDDDERLPCAPKLRTRGACLRRVAAPEPFNWSEPSPAAQSGFVGTMTTFKRVPCVTEL